MSDQLAPSSGLVEPVALNPPSGAYATGGFLMGSKKLLAGLLLVGVVATATFVALETTSGQTPEDPVPPQQASSLEVTLAPTPFESDASTLGPTKLPTGFPSLAPTNTPTWKPTISPTTPIPTVSPSASPTHFPTSSPSQSPTKSPTTSPTASPSKSPSKSPTTSPTRSPSKSPSRSPSTSPTRTPTVSPTLKPTPPTATPTTPTMAPTVDVSTKNLVDNCTQDVFVFIDVSNSIGQNEQLLQREFAQVLVEDSFSYAREADSVRFGLYTFAETVYDSIVPFDSDDAVRKASLVQALQRKHKRRRYTGHDEVLKFVLDMKSAGRPTHARFDENTGAGLSVVLMSDGAPKLRRKTFKASRDIVKGIRDEVMLAMPKLKIWCFSPVVMSQDVIDYYREVCHGYWYTESSAAEANIMSSIATSKMCTGEISQQQQLGKMS